MSRRGIRAVQNKYERAEYFWTKKKNRTLETLAREIFKLSNSPKKKKTFQSTNWAALIMIECDKDAAEQSFQHPFITASFLCK